MKFCRSCVMPETRPDTPFDESGVCPACRHAEKKKTIDRRSREQAFRELVDAYKTESHYDCVIPVSGGKDSTYQVLKAVEFGLTPLCVCFETTLPTAAGERNLEALRNIGVDLFHIKRNPRVFRTITEHTFRTVGTAQWPLFLGAYVAPVRIAVQFQVPLLLWGENPYLEYGGLETDAEYDGVDIYKVKIGGGGLNGLTIKDLLDIGLPQKDLILYTWPEDAAVERLGLKAVYMGDYFEWDQRDMASRLHSIGWRPKEGPSLNSYQNIHGIDCDALQVHDYLKYVKFGFDRVTDEACLDIRSGRITREEGIRLVKRYEGKVPVDARRRFIDYLGLSEGDYDAVVDSFTNPDIFEQDASGEFRRDIDRSLVKKPEWRLP